MALIAAANYIYQMRKTEKDLMMAKHEVKEEARESMGDPQIKAAQRAMARRLLQRQMLADVPQADVIITNPTHYAIALQYEKDMNAPLCVAKGVDLVALKIREIGEENSVPIVESPPLARALYATVDIDEEIPEEHYKAVAEILAYVYRLKGKAVA